MLSRADALMMAVLFLYAAFWVIYVVWILRSSAKKRMAAKKRSRKKVEKALNRARNEGFCSEILVSECDPIQREDIARIDGHLQAIIRLLTEINDICRGGDPLE